MPKINGREEDAKRRELRRQPQPPIAVARPSGACAALQAGRALRRDSTSTEPRTRREGQGGCPETLPRSFIPRLSRVSGHCSTVSLCGGRGFCGRKIRRTTKSEPPMRDVFPDASGACAGFCRAWGPCVVRAVCCPRLRAGLRVPQTTARSAFFLDALVLRGQKNAATSEPYEFARVPTPVTARTRAESRGARGAGFTVRPAPRDCRDGAMRRF
ncbi:MAG: hypothetical protein WBG02_10055 [Candidatus Acidiferrum sp.]